MRELGPRPTDVTSKQIKRILLLLGIGAFAIVAAAAAYGHMKYRMYRHQADFLETIQEVRTESAEREQQKDDVRRLLLAGDFDAIDARVRELRASREEFPNGYWKLSVVYQGLAGPTDNGDWTEREWIQALDRAKQWVAKHPESIAAHQTLVNLWIGYAWLARGRRWSNQVPPEDWALYEQRVAEARQAMETAREVEEKCPRLPTTFLGLALLGEVTKAEEERYFSAAVREYPDYQPIYNIHLRFLQPRWHGAPGEWQRAGLDMIKQPGGRERYARAVWSLESADSWDPHLVSWPDVMRGFADMRGHHPDSFEIQSASCLFAFHARDRGETKRMLEIVGSRMDPTVWSDRDEFARAYHWATWEDTEVAGGDPVARFFSWVMGS